MVYQNYRGAILLSHCGKIYSRIVERILRGHVESKLGEWHQRFQEAWGTTDLIFAMKMVMEKNWEWGKENSPSSLTLKKPLIVHQESCSGEL